MLNVRHGCVGGVGQAVGRCVRGWDKQLIGVLGGGTSSLWM